MSRSAPPILDYEAKPAPSTGLSGRFIFRRLSAGAVDFAAAVGVFAVTAYAAGATNYPPTRSGPPWLVTALPLAGLLAWDAWGRGLGRWLLRLDVESAPRAAAARRAARAALAQPHLTLWFVTCLQQAIEPLESPGSMLMLVTIHPSAVFCCWLPLIFLAVVFFQATGRRGSEYLTGTRLVDRC